MSARYIDGVAGALNDARLADAHSEAMHAKRAVFKAQDACSEASYSALPPFSRTQDAILRKMEKRLAKVRAELEALDRDFWDWRGKAR